MRKLHSYFQKVISGFTLIELMIAVAIIGILAAVAIPAYLGYLRRSYLSEATSSISSIKSAEESYFTTNGCYVAADAHPATVPAGTSSAWDTAPNVWGTSGLSVRPDRTVRFQYMVYANNSWSAGSACAGSPAGNSPMSIAYSSKTSAVDCVQGTFLIPSTVFSDNAMWYYVVARGDLDGDGTASSIISAVDDSKVYNCNELE